MKARRAPGRCGSEAWWEERGVELDGQGWGPGSVTALSSSASHVASLSSDPALNTVMVIMRGWLAGG